MLRLIVMPIIAGFIGTVGLTMVLSMINRTGWTNADMVRAIGSFFTKKMDNARGAGLVIHFVSGIVIAAGYLHILASMYMTSPLEIALFGGVVGFVQGFVVSYGIVRFADRHPVQQFQEADYQVAVAHIIGHVMYGLIIGLTFAVFQLMGLDVTPAQL